MNFAVENGFQWFEIARDFPQNLYLKRETIRKIRQISEKNGIMLIVHMANYLPTSTKIPELRKGLIENIRNGIILADKVGSDRITLHTGFVEMGTSDMFYDSLIKNLKEIVKIGKMHGVNICIENFDNKPAALCIQVNDYLHVLNSVKDLKATLDIGHANTTENKPSEYFSAVKGFVMNMHVHDNNGIKDEHKCIGEGNVDFKKLFSACKKAGYYGPFMLELFPYENALKGKGRMMALWGKS